MSHSARLIGACCILATLLAASTLGAETAPRRWAIFAGPAVRESGLADLLTARLSERKDLKLVERDRLDLALRELKLSACLAPEAAGERLRLGRILKADRLLLLALEELESEKLLRLVISDADYGARLRSDALPYDPDELEALCDRCAKRLAATEKQFADGIRYLIGVPPFLSKNLTHEYDHLQFDYAALLANWLGMNPGVAVVEVEEARAIRRELNLGAENLKRRVVPLFVEGEFEMTADAKTGAPRVRLSIRVSDGQNEPRRFERTGLALADAASWLRGPLPREIVRLAENDRHATLSREQQKQLLTERAEAFSRLGSYKEAIALREAALLLDPDDVQLRLAQIDDYFRRGQAVKHFWDIRYREADRKFADFRTPEFEPWEDRRLAQWTRWFHGVAGHIEYLVENRKSTPLKAASLVRGMVGQLMRMRGYADRNQADELRKAVRDFLWRMYPQFPRLNHQPRDGRSGGDRQLALRQYDEWTIRVITVLAQVPRLGVRRGEEPQGREREREDVYRFLTQVADPQIPILGMTRFAIAPARGLSTRRGHALAARRRHPMSEPRWSANFFEEERRGLTHFYERLIQTKQPLNIYYGRLGLLALRVYMDRNETPAAKMLEEFEHLRERVVELGEAAGDPDAKRRYEFFLKRFRFDIVKRINDERRREQRMRAGPKTPPRVAARPTPKPRPGASAYQRVEEIKLVDGTRPNWHWRGLIKCTDTLDIMLTKYAVYAMSERGVARRIFEIERSAEVEDRIYIGSLYWDGQSVWVATTSSDIHVLAPDGEVRGYFAADEGLPPYDAGLRLHPIGPDQCVAIGRFGKNKRMWFALIEREPDAEAAFRARVFHTATTVFRGEPDAPDNDPHEIFRPSWLMEYTNPQTAERLLLIGRDGASSRGGLDGRPPLAVNLKTWKVSVFPSVPFDRPALLFGKHVLSFDDEGRVLLCSPPTDKRATWRCAKLPEDAELAKIKYDTWFGNGLLAYRGKIYNPGRCWRRIDPKTWRVEHLNVPPWIAPRKFQYYAVSAHYGLVGWNGGGPFELYQIFPEKLAE